MTTEATRPDAICVWQKQEQEGMPEPALLIAKLDGNIIEIQQEGQWININIDSLEEIIKALRKVSKEV